MEKAEPTATSQVCCLTTWGPRSRTIPALSAEKGNKKSHCCGQAYRSPDHSKQWWVETLPSLLAAESGRQPMQ